MTYRHTTIIACLLIIAAGATACGQDDGSQDPVTPPDNPERELPTAGGPGEDAEFAEPDYSPDVGDIEEDTGEDIDQSDLSVPECCEVRFAFPDPNGNDDEVYGVLHGEHLPLKTEGGIPVRYSNGQWGATVCMPPDYDGTYYYEFALPTSAEDQYFMDERVNPYVETTEDGGRLVNVFTPADSCAELDASVHSTLSE